MSSYTHFSDGFHALLDVWPKGYLTFPSKEVRGSSLSKAWLTIENVNKKPVAIRIVNEQNSTLKLKASPTQCILIPGAAQRIEIVNTTDYPSCISDRVYIEAIMYDKDFSSATSQNFDDLFAEKSVDFYCLKCYETTDLALIPMQEELFRVEQRLKAMDCALKSFNHWFLVRNYSYPFMLMILVFLATLFTLWAHYSLNQWATCQCVLKHRVAAQNIVKKVMKPVKRIEGRLDVTLYDKNDAYMFVMKQQTPKIFQKLNTFTKIAE